MSDLINHPPHYTDGPPCPACGVPVECITFTERHNFNLGNAIKYLWRAGKKDPDAIQDLEKAQVYLKREIARIKRRG